jgi:CRP-like cAMP-binding protein/glyoxylase-like metal-dependent hydrolase (beta-lactamase superfamily II)
MSHATDTTLDKIEIDHVMPGADVIRVGGHQLALGFPEEVVKAWMRGGKEVTGWVVPDVRSAHGIVQWALEFPLYHALFVQKMFGRGVKLPVLVHRRDWDDVVTYLRLTLLGLTRQELKREGVAPATVEMLVTEGEALALKKADGSVAQVEDFLEPRFFDGEGVVELPGLRVRSHGGNTYSFFTAGDRVEEYRLEVPEGQLPPYTAPLNPGNTPPVPQPLEVITLGTGNGFDVRGPCSSTLVQANGRFLLVDCGPYIRTLLNHSGVSLNQVNAVIITHAHEDHAVGLSALLHLTHRTRLFLTRENAAIMRRKLAILNPQTSSPDTLLTDAFDLTLVEPGRDYDFLGLTLRFHYTMHTIPCTGVRLTMRDGPGTRSVLMVGDHNARANVEKAARDGVLSPARVQELAELYASRNDLLIADAGAGLIHGMPADFRDNPSTNVVYVHTGSLKEEERHLYSLAEPGHRYTIIAESSRPTPLERSLAHRALVECFGPQEHDLVDTLLDAATPVSVNRGHVVVRQGDRGQDVFMALTGELRVVVEQGGAPRKVAEIHAGEVFGEMAAVHGTARTASVVADTPARLLRVVGDVFRRFAEQAGLVASLPDTWRKRADLQGVALLERASVTTRNQLARHAVRRNVSPGATLIREGSTSDTVFVLVQGRVQVFKGNAPLLVEGAPVIVDKGSLMGETAPFLKAARNASIVALDDCEVLAIRGADFKRIIQRSPQLFCGISAVVKQRQAA